MTASRCVRSSDRLRLLSSFEEAQRREDADPDPAYEVSRATDDAYDALAEWKIENDECMIARCSAVTPEHAYCPEHR